MTVGLHFVIDSGLEFLYVSSYVGFVVDKWHWDRFSLLSSIFFLLLVIILRCLFSCLSTPSPVANEMLLFAATPRRPEAIIIIIILIALSTFRDICFNLLSSCYAFVGYLFATIEIYIDVRIHLNDAVWRCV